MPGNDVLPGGAMYDTRRVVLHSTGEPACVVLTCELARMLCDTPFEALCMRGSTYLWIPRWLDAVAWDTYCIHSERGVRALWPHRTALIAAYRLGRADGARALVAQLLVDGAKQPKQ